MDRIYKQITLESLKSRIPGSLSVVGSETKQDNCVHYVSGDGNYGKLISDIEIPQEFLSVIMDYTDTDILLPNDNGYYEIGYDVPSYHMLHAGDGVYFYLGSYEVDYPNSLIDGSEGYSKIQMPTIYSVSHGNVIPHKYLKYYTLCKWYHFFEEYYSTLNVLICKEDGTRHRFSSFSELKNLYPEIADEFDEEYMQIMDDTAYIRGGRAFYDWMCTNCFTKYMPPSGTSMPEYMFYSQVVKEIAWFEERNEKYSGVTSVEECEASEDCCECKEYMEKGGYDMYQWLISIESPDDSMCTHESSITLPILLTNKARNIGDVVAFCSEWDKDEVYNKDANGAYSSGCVVLFEGKSYILNANGKNDGGYNYSEKFRERIFGNQDPNSYNAKLGKYNDIDYASRQWGDATEEYVGSDYGIPIVYSGECDSTLTELIDYVTHYDDDSNELPGMKKETPDGRHKIIQKDSCLDIRYHPGTVKNLKNTDTDGLFFGDIIVGMTYTRKDSSGTVKKTVHSNPLHVVRDIDAELGMTSDDTLEVKVHYMKNTTIIPYYDTYISTDVMFNEDMSIDIDNLGWFTILYTDTYVCKRKNHPFYIDSIHSFPICYYEISDETRTDTTFLFKSKFMSSDNEYNGMIWVPTTRRPVYLGISGKEKQDISIYIDRGVHAMMERQMKLGEVTNLDELVEHGNGFFKVIGS